ncbi:MAG: ferritin-like domain-containing protein [Candidatus Eremiobacteraeota bacterium]|nr:ferritin-like domain-containing protein [Candidatus Eremiobacteraeota bacterium]MBC5804064.1 ferritin-like domain-containing protein [Candidatus Eremiobacteraeota bacterium]MBC5821639.1 ferritin-like domain-containing protein [Candidatus Eremiobacteraeota bacterium]
MIDGSQAHKTLFCQTFIDTHRPFEPAELPWPQLDERSIDRLRSIPFWSVALAAERNAGYMVTAYAAKVDDPLIKRALALQGVEETRHANLLAEMLERYHIDVADKTVSRSPATKRNFIDFGYEECIDSFFGFGIFGLAKQIQLFVPELTDIFELVLLEEARHVTFFVNWVAYERIRHGLGWRPFQGAATALGYVRAVKRIATTFAPRAEDKKRVQGVGFGAEGAFSLFEDVTWRSFLASCVRGHEHYMSAMPASLIKPTLLPNAARFALAIVPAWRKPASRATAA